MPGRRRSAAPGRPTGDRRLVIEDAVAGGALHDLLVALEVHVHLQAAASRGRPGTSRPGPPPPPRPAGGATRWNSSSTSRPDRAATASRSAAQARRLLLAARWPARRGRWSPLACRPPRPLEGLLLALDLGGQGLRLLHLGQDLVLAAADLPLHALDLVEHGRVLLVGLHLHELALVPGALGLQVLEVALVAGGGSSGDSSRAWPGRRRGGRAPRPGRASSSPRWRGTSASSASTRFSSLSARWSRISLLEVGVHCAARGVQHLGPVRSRRSHPPGMCGRRRSRGGDRPRPSVTRGAHSARHREAS